jgi:UDP-N-acetylglucosamine 2-epimerase (non-hydrolysing)
MLAIEPVLLEHAPRAAVVVGDVNSTVAVALTAAKLRVPVAHVEAGLRSRDWTMPEEVNRAVTDRCSSWLLAPSEDAVSNLLAEGAAPDAVHLVGNVMIDTLLRRLPAARERPMREQLGLSAARFGLVTLHRPSNVDDPTVLGDLLGTLGMVALELPLVFPVHPRTRPLIEQLGGAPTGVMLIDPVGYLDFVHLQDAAAVVLTDSGGVQEETTVLGTPCITLRVTTERPITVDEGTNRVVGTDRSRILAAVADALEGRIAARRPALWDGKAGDRVAEALLGAAPVDPTG